MAYTANKRERITRADVHIPDSRGAIEYFRLPEMIGLVGIIPSAKGSLRGNHYHPEQQQKLLILSGWCLSLSKALGDTSAPLGQEARAGDLITTPPNVAHATIFLEDTIAINLVNGERDLATYDDHTRPFPLVEAAEVAGYAALYGVTL